VREPIGRIALPCGLVADLFGAADADDGPVPSGSAASARPRRDPESGHRWQSCLCVACARRRAHEIERLAAPAD
jgi:hypothetical protein